LPGWRRSTGGRSTRGGASNA